jgi:hypothetical protein
LLVLDEPTGDLDVEAERAVRDALSGLRGRRSVVVLTHRVALAAEADRVVVLDRGRVVEDGPPELLLAKAAAGPTRRSWRHRAARARGARNGARTGGRDGGAGIRRPWVAPCGPGCFREGTQGTQGTQGGPEVVEAPEVADPLAGVGLDGGASAEAPRTLGRRCEPRRRPCAPCSLRTAGRSPSPSSPARSPPWPA